MIGLIGCGARKLSTAAPARDLYTGPLFLAARAYVEVRCERWGILSAKHGFLDPDEVVEPYDQAFLRMSARDRKVLEMGVGAVLRARFPGQRFLWLAPHIVGR